VERVLYYRAIFSELSPTGALSKALVTRNLREAANCAGFRATPSKLVANPGKPQRMLVNVPQPSSANGKPCLRIVYRVPKDATLKVALPARGTLNEFDAFRRIRLAVTAGTNTVTLLLPDYLAGKQVLIIQDEPAPDLIEIKSAEIGERAPGP
jgi:hypothetical protein